jgi:hypothetical protein
MTSGRSHSRGEYENQVVALAGMQRSNRGMTRLPNKRLLTQAESTTPSTAGREVGLGAELDEGLIGNGDEVLTTALVMNPVLPA